MIGDHNFYPSNASGSFNNGCYGNQNFANASIGSGNFNGNFSGAMRLAYGGNRNQEAHAYYESVYGEVSPYSGNQNQNLSGGMNYSQAYSGNSSYNSYSETSYPTDYSNLTYAGNWKPSYSNEVHHVSYHRHYHHHGPVYIFEPY